MHLSFPANKQIELSFKVGIAGTSSVPQSVQIVLEKNSIALAFSASSHGDMWTAIIDSPGTTFGTGQVKMSVNVLLNSKLFTPMKGTADITADAESEEPLSAEEQVELSSTAEQVVPDDAEELATSKENPPVQLGAKDIRELFLAAKKAPVTEKVEVVVRPMKMQLLKSIEPGSTKPKVVKVIESTIARQPESLFKLKKSKIVYK
jgi:hypothetical protein